MKDDSINDIGVYEFIHRFSLFMSDIDQNDAYSKYFHGMETMNCYQISEWLVTLLDLDMEEYKKWRYGK